MVRTEPRVIVNQHNTASNRHLQAPDIVLRGQEGRVLQGLIAGGRCYGYRNVPGEDIDKIGKYGRPTVVGVRGEVEPEQAEVIVRIFRMCADGMSLAQIAKTLNAEGVTAPQPARNRKHRAWVTSSIREMLYNERYRGVLVWNRTKKDHNPETGRKMSRPRPASEWKRVEVPDLRVVPEDLWLSAHESYSQRKTAFTSKCARSGVTKASSSKYLFDGLLVYGECGSKRVIVAGRGERSSKTYGCPSHGYRGTCSNRLMIRVDRLEAQLLAFLENNILNREMAEYTVTLFESELNKRLQEMAERSSEHQAAIDKLRAERDEIRARAYKIGQTIATKGHSTTLLDMLAAAEGKIADIERRIEAHRPPDIQASVEEVRDYAYKALLDLKSLIRSVTQKAKIKLAQHVKELVMAPKQRDGEWV